jgi:hypothetical protein
MSSNSGKLGLSIGLIVVVIGCSALASVAFPDWKPPADWLLAWTSLVLSVLGIVVAAKAFWAGGEAAKEYVLKMKRERIIAEANLVAK